MNSISGVSIKNYRAIDNAEFKAKPITIIVGPNNCGKSSVLEAMSLAISEDNNFKDSLGYSVLQYLSNKYSIGNLARNPKDSVLIDIDNCKTELTVIYSGYPDNEKGRVIQDFLKKSIDSFFERADIIKEINYSFNENSKYNLKSGQQSQPAPINIHDWNLRDTYPDKKQDSNIISDEENDIYIKNIENSFSENLNRYIHSLKEDINSEIFNAKKLILSRFKSEFLENIQFRLIFRDNLKNQMLKRFMNYFQDKFPFGIQINNNCQKRTLISGLEKKAVPLEKLHDLVVEKNLINETITRIVNEIPYINDIRKTDKGMMVSLAGHDNMLPISSMGDGFKSILEVFFLSALAKQGVVILEEPEVSLHPGYIQMFCEMVINSSKETQFFFSTHSRDIIEEILETARQKNSLDDIAILRMHNRMDLHASEIEILSGTEALDDIESINCDLRGV